MNLSLLESSAAVRAAAKSAAFGLVEREAFIDLILLAAVAREHLLVIGPPGTAKSAVVRRIANIFDGKYFEHLLGRFTEPSELFGPVDFKRLRDGIVETAVEGMLPEADLAFLDEVFLGSTAVLNTLLGILNERRFRRGHTHMKCPLKICVAASNHLPDDEALAAFADRFLVRYFIEPVPDSELEFLLEYGWQGDHFQNKASLSMSHLDLLSSQAEKASMRPLQSVMAESIRILRKENIMLSDRRIVKSQRLIAAAAVLDGRENPNESDLWPLLYVIQSKEDQRTARELLKDKLATSQNATLIAAAENASLGPLARAQRLIEQVNQMLLLPAEQLNPKTIEALGREIDTSFAIELMPEQLKIAREKLLKLSGEFE
ncbi:MAG: AAA family ATPase [Cellvibrio sp.]